MKKYYCVSLIGLPILFISIIYPNSLLWTKFIIPETKRIEKIVVNNNDDILTISYWHDPNIIFGGWTNKLHLKEVGKSIFQQIYDHPYLSCVISNTNYIYITAARRIYKSIDKGQNWETIVDTLPVSFVHTIGISPNGKIFIGANSTNYCSKDNGKSWTKLDLENQVQEYLFINDDVILAGVISGYFPNPPSFIYRSSDGGETWEEVLTLERTYSWSFVQGKDGNIFAASSQYDTLNSGGIYLSVDNGINWKQVNNGLPSLKVKKIAIDSKGTIFNTIENAGIYYSTNNGNNWEKIDVGLIDSTINSIFIDSKDNLYIGTKTDNDTASIYLGSTITSIQKKEIVNPIEFILSQNYPNPFNPTTRINYTIPINVNSEQTKVRLIIYNILGEKVKTLVDNLQSVGSYHIEFHASDFPTGVYFYKLQAGEFTQTKKMLLVK
ncbi:MAG: T9SS type A sorting domain-containing protein [Ignavibacteriae bacterium]|nr:T9SS type A sorting domain-containing protein [Ignavibacteriota bacterium]